MFARLTITTLLIAGFGVGFSHLVEQGRRPAAGFSAQAAGGCFPDGAFCASGDTDRL